MHQLTLFVLYFICSTDVALKLQQLFFRVDVNGKLNSLPKSFALPLCFLKACCKFWQFLLNDSMYSSIFDAFAHFPVFL